MAGGAGMGVSTQRPQSWCSPVCLAQEEAAKSLLAEFNLGCDAQRSAHVYRVYVSTFLGFGGNFARQRYEDALLNHSQAQHRYRTAAGAGAAQGTCPGPSRSLWLLPCCHV